MDWLVNNYEAIQSLSRQACQVKRSLRKDCQALVHKWTFNVHFTSRPICKQLQARKNVQPFHIACTLHNVLFGQYVFLPTEQAETSQSISFNIYLSQLVRLEGKLDFWRNRDFQTLNLGFPILSVPKIMFLVPENEKRNKFSSFLPKRTQEN